MNNEPVAELVLEQMTVGDASALRVNWLTPVYPPVGTKLYTHPHPDNLGLAESIIKQQELRIADLEKQLEDAKDESADWQMSYENCHRMCNGYGMN